MLDSVGVVLSRSWYARLWERSMDLQEMGTMSEWGSICPYSDGFDGWIGRVDLPTTYRQSQLLLGGDFGSRRGIYWMYWRDGRSELEWCWMQPLKRRRPAAAAASAIIIIITEHRDIISLVSLCLSPINTNTQAPSTSSPGGGSSSSSSSNCLAYLSINSRCEGEREGDPSLLRRQLSSRGRLV